MAEPRSYPLSRAAVRRRFFQAVEDIQAKTGWQPCDIARHYHLPVRSVQHWLRREHCPKRPRLKTLCRIFEWKFEAMFEREALEDEIFDRMHLNLSTLNRRFCLVQSRDPLDSWTYVALAGALVFDALSKAGFECQAILDHSFGTRISFRLQELSHAGLKIEVIAKRGLVISWINASGSTQGEVMDLSNSTLDLIRKHLHDYIKA